MVALIAALGLLMSASAAKLEPPAVSSQVAYVPPGAQVLATVSAGPDAAGITETLTAYFVTGANSTFGRVEAIVERSSAADSQVYRLGEDLGEAAYAALVARDLNGDGVTELAVFGGVGAHGAVLHIFRWNGDGYSLLDQFFGDSGIALTDLDGDGLDEVVVGIRHYDRAQLRHDTILRWDGTRYAPAYSRWGFTFDPALLDYPEVVVLKYYLAISRRDYRSAYALLGQGMQSGQSFAVFEQGFAGTRDVRVEDLEVTREDLLNATIRVEISSVERDGTVSRYGGTWLAEREGASWWLSGAYMMPI